MLQHSDIKACIFDMDGLLFDTEALCIEVWQSIGKKKGIEISYDLFLQCVGRNSHDTKSIVLSALGQEFLYETFFSEARKEMLYYMDVNGVPEKEGAKNLLLWLYNQKTPIALATSSSKESASWMIEKAGLTKYFSAFAFGSEVARGKPEPDIFLLAASLLGDISPKECVVFEDSTAGLKAAFKGGMRSIFVKDLIQPPDEVLATVWKNFDSLSEVSAFL